MQDYMIKERIPVPSRPVPSRPASFHPNTTGRKKSRTWNKNKKNTLRVGLADRQGSQQSFISGKISKLFRSENDTLKIFWILILIWICHWRVQSHLRREGNGEKVRNKIIDSVLKWIFFFNFWSFIYGIHTVRIIEYSTVQSSTAVMVWCVRFDLTCLHFHSDCFRSVGTFNNWLYLSILNMNIANTHNTFMYKSFAIIG